MKTDKTHIVLQSHCGRLDDPRTPSNEMGGPPDYVDRWCPTCDRFYTQALDQPLCSSCGHDPRKPEPTQDLEAVDPHDTTPAFRHANGGAVYVHGPHEVTRDEAGVYPSVAIALADHLYADEGSYFDRDWWAARELDASIDVDVLVDSDPNKSQPYNPRAELVPPRIIVQDPEDWPGDVELDLVESTVHPSQEIKGAARVRALYAITLEDVDLLDDAIGLVSDQAFDRWEDERR